MAAPRYLKNSGGKLQEVIAATAGGAGNEEKIPSLDGSGRLPATMMPTGIGADTAQITASEALAAGDWVNVHASTGAKVRKADATAEGKEVDGFVLSAVSNGAVATVYFEGENNQLSSLTAGAEYFIGTTPGQATATAPTGSGNVVQSVGKAVSTVAINFERRQPITLA